MSLDILIPQSQFKSEPTEPNHLQILNNYDYNDNYKVNVGVLPC